jgi:hypothetical protein
LANVAWTGEYAPDELAVGRRALTSTAESTLPPRPMITAETCSDEPLRWLR